MSPTQPEPKILEANSVGYASLETDRIRSEWALPETLQQLMEGGDGELVLEIIDLFKSDTADRLLVLRQALTQLDGAKMKAQAHAIKGSAVQVGATSLAALCQRIESEAPVRPCRELEGLVSQAEGDFEILCRLGWAQPETCQASL